MASYRNCLQRHLHCTAARCLMLTASEEHRPQPETLSEGAAVLKLMLRENSNTAAQSELFHLKRGVFRNSHLS